jgi:exosortase D (VPLPA-CTERM-specific)
VVACGGFIFLVDELAATYTLGMYACLITLMGLVLALTGGRAYRLLAVPLFILLFMVPLPRFLFQNLSNALQLWSSQIGVWFIRLLDISVYLEGNVIDLGGYKLQVAEACDGLRYLFPLMTLGFLIAYFYKGAFWKRAVLFLSSIPITVFMNSLRIGTIGVMVEHWGIGMAEGFLHEFQGWMVFMTSMALMIAEIALLHRVGRESGSWRQVFGIEFPAPTPAAAELRNRMLPAAFAGACAVLVGVVLINALLSRPEEITPARTPLAEFPLHVANWSGRRSSLDGVYLDILNLDDYVLTDYQDVRNGDVVDFYVAWYNSQRKGTVVHSPRACLPGGGWQMRDLREYTLDGVLINGKPLRVNRSVIELGNQRELVYYWFQQRGRVITGEFAVKWYLFWDSLTRHRTDGALVRLVIPLDAGATEVSADRELANFVARIAPDLSRYIPN